VKWFMELGQYLKNVLEGGISMRSWYIRGMVFMDCNVFTEGAHLLFA
jgi:hypothetical protein